MLATRQAEIAGALHDRDRTLRYLAEQEAYSRAQPAGVVAHETRSLAWLEHDPVLRRPYIYGRPCEATAAER